MLSFQSPFVLQNSLFHAIFSIYLTLMRIQNWDIRVSAFACKQLQCLKTVEYVPETPKAIDSRGLTKFETGFFRIGVILRY